MMKFVEKNCGWYFIRSISSLYDGSRGYVRLGSRVGEYFEEGGA